MISKLDTGLLLIFFVVLNGCVPKQVDIKYGVDACAYCKMNIVDPKFGAELITKKGRVYKFDAIECMINYDHEMQKPVAHYLVNMISQPGVLVPAEECQYIISEAMPSPMGANLSAHRQVDDLRMMLDAEGAKHLAWDAMRNELVRSNAVH